MPRVTTLGSSMQNIDALNRLQSKVQNASIQLSQGKKNNADPVAAAKLLQLNQAKKKNEQYQKNADAMQAQLQAQESALADFTNQLQAIRTSIISVNTASYSQADRDTVVTQLEQNLENLIATANERSSEGYLFSGASPQLACVKISRDPSGKIIYKCLGDELQNFLPIADNVSVKKNVLGKQIFFQIAGNDCTSSSSQIGFKTSGMSLRDTSTLSGLMNYDCKINDILVKPSVSDGVSSSKSEASAIALANAINLGSTEHQVMAKPNPNVLNLGTYGQGIGTLSLGAGEFSVNGVAVLEPLGTPDNLVDVINLNTELHGVTASLSGSQVTLTAIDGRNIQAQTAGGSFNGSFSNFSTAGPSLDQTQSASLNLSSINVFKIRGLNLNRLSSGLVNGMQGGTANLGNCVISDVIAIGQHDNNLEDTINLKQTYLMRFHPLDANNPVNTYSLYAIDNLNQAISQNGKTIFPYQIGEPIQALGMEFKLSGSSLLPGDSFVINNTPNAKRSVFASIRQVIESIKTMGTDSAHPDKLSYALGVGLEDLDAASQAISTAVTQCGTGLNLIETKRDSNNQLNLQLETAISGLEGLNLAESISEFSNLNIMYQAALGAASKLQSTSLNNR